MQEFNIIAIMPERRGVSQSAGAWRSKDIMPEDTAPVMCPPKNVGSVGTQKSMVLDIKVKSSELFAFMRIEGSLISHQQSLSCQLASNRLECSVYNNRICKLP